MKKKSRISFLTEVHARPFSRPSRDAWLPLVVLLVFQLVPWNPVRPSIVRSSRAARLRQQRYKQMECLYLSGCASLFLVARSCLLLRSARWFPLFFFLAVSPRSRFKVQHTGRLNVFCQTNTHTQKEYRQSAMADHFTLKQFIARRWVTEWKGY